MNCKYCGAELTDGATVCPACGKPQDDAEATETTETVETAETAETAKTAKASAAAEAPEAAEASESAVPAEDPESADTEQPVVKSCGRTEPCATCDALAGCDQADQYFAQELDEQKQAAKKGGKGRKVFLGIVAGVLVVALIAALIVAFLPKKVAHTVEIGEEEYTSYTATSEQLTRAVLDQVVATCGKDKLTNRALGLYYWQQFYIFANAYGSYLPYLMDTSIGLDVQLYDENITWQQQFLDSALLMFQHISALSQEAAQAGYTMTEEDQAYIDSILSSLTEATENYGFDSADAFLQAQFGPGVTETEYTAYLTDSTLAMSYLNSLVDAQSYTDEDISAFFDEHADAYAQNHIQKLDVPNIDIRHILIVPAEQNEDGTYTDAAWAAAEEQAQQLYTQWLAGEATEDSFAALAQEHSADGSASAGGLITDVHPGQMVTEFNDWCFDAGREVGDSGIVKSQFGYHLMYFSGVGDEIYWRSAAESDYLSERSSELEEQIAAKYVLKSKLDNAAVFDVLQAAAQ